MTLMKKTLAACFVSSLAAANIVASKIASFSVPVIGEVIAPAGFIGVAMAFLFSDLIGELYGETEARSIVNAAIISMLVVYGVVYSAVLIPAAPFYQYAESFTAIMGAGGTVVASSILTLLVSQNIDVSLFHRIKSVSDVKAARNIGSTAVSQAIDTVLFIGLAFVVLPVVFAGTPMEISAAAGLAVSQYSVKIAVALLDTPLFYAISGVFERG